MKVVILRKTFKVLQGVALSATVFFASAVPVSAANLSMANTPLFLGAAVQPNVFFVSDDSGSMDWEFVTPAHWRWNNYDPDPIRNGSFDDSTPISSQNTDGTIDSAEFEGTDSSGGGYGYIYSNSDNVYGNDCTSTYYGSRAESCADATNHPLDVEWRGRSAGLNKIFYDTNIEYQPWDGPCNASGTACANASYTSARSDPYSTQPGYSITRNLATDGDANNGPFIYEVWIDDSGYTGTIPRRGSNFNETGHASTAFTPVITGGIITSDAGNNEVDLWDSHMRFTVTNAEINVKLIEYNPVPSGGTRGLNETIRVDTDISNSACYDVLGSDAMVKSIRDNILADPANATNYIHAQNTAGCKTIAEVRQNVANWYQYYRRRAFPVKNAIAEVIDAQPTFRFGMTLINRYDQVFTQVPDISVTNFSAHNTSIKQEYFAYRQASNGTPLRSALYRAGQYFDDTLTSPNADDPIVYSCQKNFTVLFTDGYYSGSFSSLSDRDGDNISPTLSDISYYFYDRDLSPLADNVQVDLPLESDLPLNTALSTDGDPRTHQHMVTFTVAFGVTGNLSDADGDDLPDLDGSGNAWATGAPTKSGNWAPDVFSSTQRARDLARIDDLWHAAFNSAGIYASASSPTEVSQKLVEAISAIASRVGSASAVALNSGTLNANSRLYQARFNSNGWSGDIFSVPIQDGEVDIDGIPGDDSPLQCALYPTLGELCDMEWSGGQQLATLGHAARTVFSMKTDDHSIVEFSDITDLSTAQQTALRTNPDTLAVETVSRGQDRLDYLRGDHSKEADQSGGSFRVRLEVRDFTNENGLGVKSILGDIIHSAPAFVGAPAFSYPNTLEADRYAAYRVLEKDREGIVYVNSNDGMLHAFAATTGVEKFAYTPGALTNKLNLLTSPVYNSSHSYFLDGSPIIFDAYKSGVNSGWNTMLASSAGAGAQLVFGLNVTDPSTVNLASNLSPWEFTDSAYTDVNGVHGDADLGFTLGDVSYGKMNTGGWAVIFGNGYNNTFADGNVSTTGNAVIYVVDAFNGALIKKLDTQVGMAEDPTGGSRPNGISTVTPVDMDGDFKVDVLYAGDLFGNVWKVDVTNSNPASWNFAYTSAGAPTPFFIAQDSTGVEQPITSALAIKRHPIVKDQTLVLFGTGKYFEVGDSASTGASTQIQTFYGIWDNNTGIQHVRSNLLEQEIINQVIVTGTDAVDREFRLTSSEKDNTDYAIDWSTDKGWYMDLRYGTEYGERVVADPLIRNNRIIFVTQTPDEDPCSSGGTSWIMEINANDGNRLDVPPFDVNGDGIIDDLDVVSYLSDANTITSGVRSKEGIVAQPGILNKTQGQAGEFKYFAGTKGGTDVVIESASSEFRKRQSWRQIR